jgi:hypothetical protein
MRTELLRRVAFLSTFGIATFSGGVLLGHSRHRRLPDGAPLPAAALAPFGDGGAGVPAAFLVFPASSADAPVCIGPSCPFPGPEPGAAEHHDCVVFLQDQGGAYAFDTRNLVSAAWNEQASTLVLDYGENLVVCDGENEDRLYKQLRKGSLELVESCSVERPSEAEAAQGDSGYAIAHVRVLPSGSWHFDKTGAFVSDEQ